LILLISIQPCLSQTRLVEFVKPDSTFGFYDYSYQNDRFIGLSRVKYYADTLISERCDFRYFIYNTESGDIEDIEDFYYLLSDKYCLFPRKLIVDKGIKYLYSTPQNVGENNQLVLTVTEEGDSKFYQEKWDEDRDRILDMGIQHLNSNGLGYIVENQSQQNSSRTIRYFEFKILGDSLNKELLNISTTKSQLSVGVFEAMNDNYLASFALYQNLTNFNSSQRDSISGIDIYRLDKINNNIDSTFIPFDSNYRFVEGALNNDRFVFPLIGQDSTIKNAYHLSNKIKMFAYDFDENELEFEKEVKFENNVGLVGFNYDEISDRYYMYGYSTNAKIYSASYTDYWLGILDNDFNIILDYRWKEEVVDRLEESVYSFESIGNNKFYMTYGADDITGQIIGSSFSGIVSLDMLTSINEEKENPLISFYPNPARDYLIISNNTLPYNVKLYSLSGNMITDVNYIFDSEYRLSLTSLSRGIYVLKIGNDYFKFIKE
jgi:hypothetical protein